MKRSPKHAGNFLAKGWWALLIVTFLLSYAHGQEKVVAVGPVGMTVSDMNRSVDFFSNVLSFEKISDAEVWGTEYERLEGVFGLRMHVVRMKLGDEAIELTEYLAPKGKPYPVDTRSNDRWFQHIAIVVSDMDKAYAQLRKFNVQHASTGPQTLPPSITAAAGIRAFYFRDPDGHFLEIIWSKGIVSIKSFMFSSSFTGSVILKSLLKQTESLSITHKFAGSSFLDLIKVSIIPSKPLLSTTSISL